MKISTRFTFLLGCLLCGISYGGDFELASPNGQIKANITVSGHISWSITHNGEMLLAPCRIAMHTDQGKLGIDSKVESQSRNQTNETLTPVVPEKRRKIQNKYNELVLFFEGEYNLEFRVFDDGAAYRFITDFDQPLTVQSEPIEFNFTADHNIYFPKEESLITHQERMYLYQSLSSIKPKEFSSIPAVVDIKNGPKVGITESDLFDYPGFYLTGTGGPALKTKFPNFVLEESLKGDRTSVIKKRADYIAKTEGRRSFPWRIVIVAEKDTELLNCQIVWKLARPCQIKDTSWIKPGKVAWDWYNANNIYGVDFKAGVNTKTYKYYIDFASKHGIEYIILDEGWYKLGNLLDIVPEMDLEELLRYAKEKNVGIILWMVWKTLDNQFDEALDTFEKWGCKGLKVDFMQRDDQWMVNFYERVARAAAKRKMLVDFHGSYKPSGLRRAYPNVLTYETVNGGEQNKWCGKASPDHNVTMPYIRMPAGPVDYTPGAMINAQKKNFKEIFTRPMSQGTRCHQLAMYTIFESPLQMLCDSPSHYYREPECMKFLVPVPTVWDETIVLDGKIGQYILTARKSGSNWYIGAMTNWNKRTLAIDLSFLPEDKYTAQIWQDGPNAERYASDFQLIEKTVSNSDKLKINLALGGGWTARLIKQ